MSVFTRWPLEGALAPPARWRAVTFTTYNSARVGRSLSRVSDLDHLVVQLVARDRPAQLNLAGQPRKVSPDFARSLAD